MMKKLFCLFLLLMLPGAVFGASAATTLVDRQEMEQVLTDFLEVRSSQLPHVELHLKSAVYPDPYAVPQGRIVHDVVSAKPGVVGSRRLTLITRVDGQTVSNRSIRVDLEALAEVVVATTSKRRGSLLGPVDTELRLQDVSRLKDPIFDPQEIVGKRVKRSVRLGDPLQKHQVEFPPVIKRGEKVVIQARRGGLVITAAGEAREDGRSGESIRVRNSNSQKEVVCQVVAPGTVKVEF